MTPNDAMLRKPSYWTIKMDYFFPIWEFVIHFFLILHLSRNWDNSVEIRSWQHHRQWRKPFH